jgi:hypothetical protein
MQKVNSANELSKVFTEKGVKVMQEYCDDCEELKPLSHFKFVDGMVYDHPANFTVFTGSSTCKLPIDQTKTEENK